MDVRIYCGEELKIVAMSEDGKTERHLRVSWRSVMFDGVILKDGLAPEEIRCLDEGRKIVAIRLVRGRTGFGLKEAKDLIEAYAKKNHCCEHFPNCDHFEEETGINPKLLQMNDVGTLAMSWSYPGRLTEDQAKTLMARASKPSLVYGIWSFMPSDSQTTWMSNRFSTPVV